MQAKSGKQAMANLQSALTEATKRTEEACALASSNASREDKREAAESASLAIDRARAAELYTRYASTGTNPDLGTPVQKRILASASEHAHRTLIEARRKIADMPGVDKRK